MSTKIFLTKTRWLIMLLTSLGVTNAWGESFTFTPTSASAGTLSGAPTGVTATFSNSYNSANQITKNNSQTLTLSGLDGCTITGVSVSVHNNKSSGAGSGSLTINGSNKGSLSGISGLGNSSWTTKNFTVTSTEVATGGTVVVTISCSTSSVYCNLYTITYSPASGPTCSTNPTVGGSSNSSINVTGGTVSCTGITKGDCDIDEWGFVYGTATEPTGNAQKVSSGKSTTNVPSFNKTLTGLDPNVKYYVRAYAKVGSSTFYGSETNFTTKTITASSSNTTYGTVSRSKMVITGSPKSGGQYASPAYTVTGSTPANATTVTQSGNTFTVTSTSTTNITVTINFEAIPTYTVTWVAGSNSSFNSQTGTAGTALTDPGTPSAASYCPGGKVFVGWTATPIDGEQNSAPADLFTSVSGKSIPSGGTTYYAVFAEVSGELSNSYAAITSGLETANYVIAYSYNGGTQIVLQNTADNSSPSDKLEGYNLSLSDSKYSNPAASYIWELRAQSDGSYYIYNTAVEKYVNATTTPALTLSTTPTKFTITYDGTNSRWTIQIKESTSYYIHGYVNGTTHDFRCSTSGSGAKYRIYLYKQESNITYAKYSTTCSTDPELSVTPTALDFGNVANGTYKEMTFSLSGTHLTANASIAVSGTNSGYFTVTPNSVDKGSGTISATNITVRYTPGAVGDGHTATVTVTSGEAEAKTVTLTGNSKATYSVSISPTPTNGTVTADKTSGIMAGETVTLTVTPSSGYQLNALTISAGGGSVTPTKVDDTQYTFTMPSNNVTVTATFIERVDFVLVKDVNDLYEGATVVFCNKGEVEKYAKVIGAYAGGNNWPAVSASVFEENDQLRILTTTANMQTLTLGSGTIDNTWSFYDETGYIYAANSTNGSNNYMKRQTTLDAKGSFTIAINTTTGLATITSQGDVNGRNKIDYNASGWFSCYSSTSTVYIYMIPSNCDKLPAPTGLSVTSITQNSATLSWNAVDHASGYNVSCSGGTVEYTSGTSATVTGLTQGTAYTWSVQATGTGDYCALGTKANGNFTTKRAVTVTYRTNGATGGQLPVTGGVVNLTEGDSHTILGNTGSGDSPSPLLKSGYTFDGWHNSSTYSATPAYTIGNSITVNENIVIYANWRPQQDTFLDDMHQTSGYTGAGHTESGSYTMPGPLSNVASGNACETSHYIFVGWVISGGQNPDGTINGSPKIWRAGESNNASGATYYAVWAEE